MLLVATPAGAQTLRGLVLEQVTEIPIALSRVVLVTLEGDSVDAALTDDQGFFSVDARDAGGFFLVASALGYRTARSERLALANEEVRVVQLLLSLRPVRVAGIDVTAPAPEIVEVPELRDRGFYQRLRSGWGEFLTPEEIRAHTGVYTPELFRELRSVQLVPDRGRGAGPWNDRVVFKRDTGSRLVGAGGELGAGLCEPAIWVDDVRTSLMPGESLDDLAPKELLEGIEVHRPGFGAPARYIGDDSLDACGAILLWTRSAS